MRTYHPRPKAVNCLVTITVGPLCFRYNDADGGARWEVKHRGEDGEINAPLRSTPTELVRHWQNRDSDRMTMRPMLEAMANKFGGEFEVVESSRRGD